MVIIKKKLKQVWDELTDPNTPGPSFTIEVIIILTSIIGLLAFIKFWPMWR